MKPTRLRSWSGLIAIAWMVGGYEFLEHAPEGFILFKFDFSAFSTQFTYLGIWLGIGLIFAIAGLRSGNSAGQICALVAIGVFIYYAWDLLYPSAVPSMSATRPNQSPEPTAVGACSSAVAVHITSRRWLSFFR
jgi:hypothetical protein